MNCNNVVHRLTKKNIGRYQISADKDKLILCSGENCKCDNGINCVCAFLEKSDDIKHKDSTLLIKQVLNANAGDRKQIRDFLKNVLKMEDPSEYLGAMKKTLSAFKSKSKKSKSKKSKSKK